MKQTAKSVEVRADIVKTFHRDLVGPSPGAEDADLATERLNENPSRWYLAGFLAPADDPMVQSTVPQGAEDDPSSQEEMEIDVEEPDDVGASGAAADNEAPEAPNTKRRFLPSSIGLTVLLPPGVKEIEAIVSWGDYRTEPPLPEDILLPEEESEKDEEGKAKKKQRPSVDWVRMPQQRTVQVAVPIGRGNSIVVPESAAPQRPGGGLTLETHARLFTYATPNGNEEVRALTVFLVNRRSAVHRFYADVAFIFQARLDLVCPQGFRPRRDLSGYNSDDFDLRVADLHYRDVCEWAVGRNAAAGWDAEEERADRVTRAWTDQMPQAEVEWVAPNEDVGLKSRVVFGMEALAERASGGGSGLRDALSALPVLYAAWIEAERGKVDGLAPRRRETAERLIADMEAAAPAHPRRHRYPDWQRDCAKRIPVHEPRVGHRRAAPQCRGHRRSGGAASTRMAAVPARVHPAQYRQPFRPQARRPRDC
jgi:hypothetical protein